MVDCVETIHDWNGVVLFSIGICFHWFKSPSCFVFLGNASLSISIYINDILSDCVCAHMIVLFCSYSLFHSICGCSIILITTSYSYSTNSLEITVFVLCFVETNWDDHTYTQINACSYTNESRQSLNYSPSSFFRLSSLSCTSLCVFIW